MMVSGVITTALEAANDVANVIIANMYLMLRFIRKSVNFCANVRYFYEIAKIIKCKKVKMRVFSCFFYVLKRFFTNWDLLSVINTYICIAIVSFKT